MQSHPLCAFDSSSKHRKSEVGAGMIKMIGPEKNAYLDSF